MQCASCRAEKLGFMSEFVAPRVIINERGMVRFVSEVIHAGFLSFCFYFWWKIKRFTAYIIHNANRHRPRNGFGIVSNPARCFRNFSDSFNDGTINRSFVFRNVYLATRRARSCRSISAAEFDRRVFSPRKIIKILSITCYAQSLKRFPCNNSLSADRHCMTGTWDPLDKQPTIIWFHNGGSEPSLCITHGADAERA